MDLTIPFSPAEEAQISAAAKQTGLTSAELIKRLALEHLPNSPLNTDETIDAKLRLWQEQDGTPLMPEVPSQTLLAKWAEEDAQMTDEERDAEDRLWEGIERSLADNEGLRLRQLSA